MYYYVFKDDSQHTREQVIAALESRGYTKSEYSCEFKDMKGIGLFVNKWEKVYIFFNDYMMSKDPHIGWVEPYREKVEELSDFLNKASELAQDLQ